MSPNNVEYPSASPTGDAWLLTPGPLTTSPEVKQAALHDYGSRDHHLIAINQEVRDALVKIIHGGDDFTTVPLQGSGTFVVEAMLGTFVPKSGKLLVLINGAYGTRMVKICEYIGRECVTLETLENVPVDPAEVDRVLAADAAISHVVIVHCETTTGILNPIAEVGEAGQGRTHHDRLAYRDRGLAVAESVCVRRVDSDRHDAERGEIFRHLNLDRRYAVVVGHNLAVEERGRRKHVAERDGLRHRGGQFVAPSVEGFGTVDAQRLVGTEGRIDLGGAIGGGQRLVRREIVGGVVGRADSAHVELF